MLPVEEARSRVMALARPTGAERLAVDGVAGRVLAEDVRAPRNMPEFDHSAMDGYAVLAAAVAEAGETRLPVRGESRAGSTWSALDLGAACRIFTGAPLPAGADAVVMQEDVARDGDVAVFRARPAPFAHVRRCGEDLAAGAVAIARGTRLRASHLALAATCDLAWVTVAARPRVVVLANGDELRAPGTPARPGSIPESNAIAIAALARAAGATAVVAPIVGDDRDALTRALDQALRDADVLVTVGGASVGDHDLVHPCLVAAGATIDFHRVAMKPGKPLMVGARGEARVLGLPGNPVSALVTFALFGAPLLRAMQGDAAPILAPTPARLARGIGPRRPGRTEFVRATLALEGGALVVTPVANQASGAITGLAAADALIVVPAERGPLDPGEIVLVLPLSELGP